MTALHTPPGVGDLVNSELSRGTDGEVLAVAGAFAWVQWPGAARPSTEMVHRLAVVRRAKHVQELL